MTESNVGSDAPRGTVCLADDMAAYDRLPPAVRTQLGGMVENWNATGAEMILRKHGEAVCLQVLQNVDAKMRMAA